MVCSRSVIERNIRTFRSELPQVELFYAAKTNPHPVIIKIMRELGCSLDVCSPHEVGLAKDVGFDPALLLHTHPCKTVNNLVSCHQAGVRLFVFDSEPELEKFHRHTPDAQLILRIALPTGSAAVDLSRKFGADPRTAERLLRAATARGLIVRGISFHVGSQCLNPQDFTEAVQITRQVWDTATALGMHLEIVDIGGGFPTRYVQEVPALTDYCRQISHALERSFGDVSPRFIAEPGRVISADAVTLITSVIGVNLRGGVPWYIIDDGIYGSFSGIVYDAAAAYPVIAEANTSLRRSVLAGPTCDSTDVVHPDIWLPELAVGDILLVPTMGAYTRVSASRFNGFSPPCIFEIP